MNEKSKTRNIKYQLVFVPYMGGEDYSFPIIEKESLEEMDRFTACFNNLDDLVSYFSKKQNRKYDISSCYVEKAHKKLNSRNVKYNIVYSEDIFEPDYIKQKYKEYCLAHPDYFLNYSPARKTIRRSEIYTNINTYINSCLLAWFNTSNKDLYRKTRGAYFELKKLNVLNVKKSKQTTKTPITREKYLDSSNYYYYFEDENYSYLSDFLGFNPNWDEVNKWPEEIKRKIMKVERSNLNGKGRRLH